MWKEKLESHKTTIEKIIAGVMSVVLVGCSVCIYQTQSLAKEQEEQEKIEEQTDLLSDIISTQVGSTKDGVDKEESVFVVSNASGDVQEVIVSDWLKNKEGSAELTDASNLQNIKNVKGDEEYTADGDSITWQTNGNDIYYQGTTDKELPVNVKVTYSLDGQEMSPEEIAGKSGKVTIRFDYENNERVEKEVDGKTEEVYVPFTVMSAMILPTDTFSNVTVTNGKIMSEGNNNIVMGLAFPGLTESLDLDEEKLEEKDIEIPKYVEVNADVTDFELEMTLSVVLSDALSDIHLTDSIDLSEIEDSMDDLNDATDQLEDGTGKLADGVKTLNDKTGELKDGTKELADGVKKYTDGVSEIANGVDTLSNGASDLANGANTLSDGASELNKQVQAISLPTVEITDEQKAQIGVAVASSPEIAAGAQTMASTIGQQTTDVLTNNATAMVTNAVTSTLTAKSDYVVTIATELTKAYIAAGMSPEDASTKATDDAKNMIMDVASTASQSTLGQVSSTLGSEEVSTALYNGCKDGLTQSAQSGALQGAQAVVSKVNDTMGGFGGKIGELKAGTEKLANGAGDLANGAGKLNDGVTTLKNGVNTLNSNSAALVSGANKLNDGTDKLVDGVGELLTGANDLNDGMVKFDKEGISKLTDALEGDGKKVVDRLDATMEAAKDYNTFTEVPEGKEGSVKFIIRTQAVK